MVSVRRIYPSKLQQMLTASTKIHVSEIFQKVNGATYPLAKPAPGRPVEDHHRVHTHCLIEPAFPFNGIPICSAKSTTNPLRCDLDFFSRKFFPYCTSSYSYQIMYFFPGAELQKQSGSGNRNYTLPVRYKIPAGSF